MKKKIKEYPFDLEYIYRQERDEWKNKYYKLCEKLVMIFIKENTDITKEL